MWHSLALGSGADASTQKSKIQNAFYLAFVSIGGPPDMAMFSATDAVAGAKGITLYFSPAATAFAKTVNAAPCEKPAIKGLFLMAGEKRCWATLFPGEQPGTPTPQ